MRPRFSKLSVTFLFALLSCLLAGSQLHFQTTSIKPTSVRRNPKDGSKYVWIPPGTFQMGCSPGDNECRNEEKPSHQVTISKGFWIGRTKETVAAYKRFVKETGKTMPPEPNLLGRPLNSKWNNDAMPIVDVNWKEACDFCSWAGGRLPTEAEWEYAARGGNPNARYGSLDEIAWYADNSGQHRLDSMRIWNKEQKDDAQQLKDNANRLHEGGRKQPNGFGLYDTLGDTWEWMADWYDDKYYQRSPTADPPGPSSGRYRVLRGGSWVSFPFVIRVSSRHKDPPDGWGSSIGFRCVREAGNP